MDRSAGGSRLFWMAVAIGAFVSAAGTFRGAGLSAGSIPGEDGAGQAAAAAGLTEEEREQHLASFDTVWETVRDQHFDPELGGLDWEAVREELRPRIEEATSASEVRCVIREMLSRLGQSHFAIFPRAVYEEIEEDPAGDPESGHAAEEEGSGSERAAEETPADEPDDPPASDEPGSAGLELRILGGRAVVTRVYEGSPAESAGIRPGCEILGVDGWVARSAIESAMEASEGEGQATWFLKRLVSERLRGDAGETVRLRLLDGRDEEIEREIRLGPVRGELTQFANLPEVPFWIETRRLDGDVGYIGFNIFLNPVKLIPIFEKGVRDFSDSRGIVIDLRGNPGGIGFLAVGLAGFFVPERDRKLGVMKTRTTELKFVINPRSPQFSGPLAVLIDGESASTSEIFAGGLKDLGRARIFGSRSAGAALPSIIVRLPNGDGFQYATANYVSEGGEELEGKGVVPHEVVIPTREQLLAGEDPALDAAREWILGQG